MLCSPSIARVAVRFGLAATLTAVAAVPSAP